DRTPRSRSPRVLATPASSLCVCPFRLLIQNKCKPNCEDVNQAVRGKFLWRQNMGGSENFPARAIPPPPPGRRRDRCLFRANTQRKDNCYPNVTPKILTI